VRQEFKKKTGIAVDEYGNVKERAEEEEAAASASSSAAAATTTTSDGSRRIFTPIDQYKPTGNLVYAPEMLETIERKVKFA
jgi:hypothetical protein